MRLATTVALFALLAAGLGGDGTAAPTAGVPRTYTASQTKVLDAAPVQRRVLRQILNEIAPTQIASVRVEIKTKRWECGASPDLLALWIDVPSGLRGRWDAELLANLYFDAASRLNIRRDDVMRVGPSPDDCLQRIGVPDAQSKGLAPLRRALALTGVNVLELRHVSGGVALTVQTDNPAEFLEDDFEFVDDELWKVAPDINFVGVLDASGALVAGHSHLGNHGESHIRPDLYACGEIAWSLAPPWNPPPCPA